MKNTAYLYSSLLLFFTSFFLIAQNQISGTVLDSDGIPLFGANVVIENSTLGTTTDENGQFSLETNQNFPINLVISYIGYTTRIYSTNTSDGSLTIQLDSGNIFDEVIVSASRKAEKLQEAPAAVSVVSGKSISESGGSLTPLRSLINTPGVELQQQTGQRINVALRGSSGIFSTGVFPMLDYRSLISPGLEYFDSQNSPINNIDLERIEVVLGPASALYGPDVTSGVIHFISKSPFRHPGTSAELIYGERNTFKIAARHALHNEKNTFGFKINARYGSGKDFTLDPKDPDDQKILRNFKKTVNRATITPEGYVNTSSPGTTLFATDGLQQPDYWAAALNSSLYFRPVDGMEIVTAGGWNAGKAIFYNDLGEGMNFSNEYWAQARFNYKGWFAQTYYINNDGGNDNNPIYLNRTGFIVPLERSHYEAQLQYNFELPKFLNSEWSLGFDYRNATANTENHVYGRNENDDDYNIAGGYFQSKFKLDPKFDFFIAGRYDGYNFTDEKTFSPRVAMVYKASPNHNLRLSYNNAANPIPASDIYFDLPTQINSGLDVWVMGGKNPYTFAADPAVDWLIPGVPDTPLSSGFPLAAAYSQVNDLVLAQLQALGAQDPQLAPLLPILLPILQNGLPAGYAPAASFSVEGEPLAAESGSAKLISQLSAFEFGYKGLFWERFALGFDVYSFRRTAGGGFSQVSPIVNFFNLPEQLGNSVQDTFQPQIEQVLTSLGFDPAIAAGTAALVGQQLNGAYTQAGVAFMNELQKAGLPFHGVIPTQEAANLDNAQLIFGYLTRDPDAISRDWGYEIHSKFYINDSFTAFGNYTWFNRPSGQPGDLNFPQNKIRTGLSYQSEKRLSASLSYQWDQAYTSNNAVFPGQIDAKSLFDLTIGYRLSESLRFEAAGTNLFNNEFRALPGLPKIGRTVTGRLLFNVN